MTGRPVPVTAETWIPLMGDTVWIDEGDENGSRATSYVVSGTRIVPDDVAACEVLLVDPSQVLLHEVPLYAVYPSARALYAHAMRMTRVEIEDAERELHRLRAQWTALALQLSELPPDVAVPSPPTPKEDPTP